MIPLPDALAAVLAACPPLAPRSLPVADSVGCVTAAPVVASEAVPTFANSAMDGFAVRAADTLGATEQAPVTLRVVATVHAGAVSPVGVGPGEAVRIMTGAPMPDGADAVVLVERSRPVAGDDGAVELGLEVEPGTSVRPAGGDVQAGDEVLQAGTMLRPAHLGVLTSLGLAEVTVVPRPRVGVVSTGDELVPVGLPLGPGQIRDSNRPMLLALVAEAGGEPVDLGWVPDDEEVLEEVLRRGAAECDVLVSSGGVSMGDADVVKLVLGRIAVMDWMQIAIRPAKPFALGVVDGTPILGLPGNPVSSLVSFELLARPALARRAGRAPLGRPRAWASAAVDLARRPDGKVHYLRVEVSFDGRGCSVAPVAAQGSHQLAASSSATGLAILPDGHGVSAGEQVEVLLLDAESTLHRP